LFRNGYIEQDATDIATALQKVVTHDRRSRD
jgi:hypothetical protein